MLDPELLAIQKTGTKAFPRFLIGEILPPCRVWNGTGFTGDTAKAMIYASKDAAKHDLNKIRAKLNAGFPDGEDYLP